jgi:hypothetical protein
MKRVVDFSAELKRGPTEIYVGQHFAEFCRVSKEVEYTVHAVEIVNVAR